MPTQTFQTADQVVDVSTWEQVDDYRVYPEGKREKRLLRCPSPAPYPFLKPGHKYLLKYSRDRTPAQYWCEILAYRLGQGVEAPVPPAHVAIDGLGRSAALIEWFLEEEKGESRISGGDYLVSLDPSFDRTKGRGHTWRLVKQLLESFGLEQFRWKPAWFNMMAFDTLIGNTDRHQENWAFIREAEPVRSSLHRSIDPVSGELNPFGVEWGTHWIGGSVSDWDAYFGLSGWELPLLGRLRFGPFFDNGTSLGYEQPEESIISLTDENLIHYIRRGRAHLRWDTPSSNGLRHFALIDRLLEEEPRYKFILRNYEGLMPEAIREIVENLIAFQVPEPLSPARAEFMVRLVTLRRHELLARLHDTP